MEVTVLQGGRKGRLARSMISLAPHLQPKAPAPDLPEPPSHFGDAERETWYAVLCENPRLNYCGCMLLGMAINALHRAQHCAEVVDKAGGPLSIDTRGRLKRHPLAGVEVANRKLARDLFKMLKIELRGGASF